MMDFLKKIGNLFKNKKFVCWFAFAVTAVIVVSTVLGIMLPSYFGWKDYYDAAIAKRDRDKYLQALPAQCLGIRAELNENVVYYDNGKARPTNSDFTVVARMSEKGIESEKILLSNEYTVLPDKGFAQHGGNITVSFRFTPEATEEFPTPETTEFTQVLPYALEKVVPVSLTRANLPYRCVYSEEMPFDGEGLNAVVTYNDGSTETVGNDEFEYASTLLATGTESVAVTWNRGGTTFDFACPVTVVKAADYDDGNIVSISPAGAVYLAPGADPSSAKPPVRATYESGNRFIIDESLYTVRGNTATASLTKKCILSIFLATDSSIYTRAAAIVKSGIEAENASLIMADKAEVNESTEVNGSYVTSEDPLTAVLPRSGSTVRFNLTLDALSKPDLSMRVALKPSDAEESDVRSVDLSEVMTMVVNGNTVPLPSGSVLTEAADAADKYVFTDVALPAPLLLNKNNEVRFLFHGKDASKIVIDRFDLEAGYKGEFFSSTEEYFTYNASAGINGEYEFTTVKPFGAIAGLTWGHSICSDGTYLYMLGHSDSKTDRAAAVAKYDPIKNEEVAVSAQTSRPYVSEEFAGITYYDNKIIIYRTDGKKMYVDVDDFTDGCIFQEYHGYRFEELVNEPVMDGDTVVTEPSKIKDVYYNAAKARFAVYCGNTLYIYNKDMTLYKKTVFAGNPKRMSGSVDYIYANYTENGSYSPKIRVYDWEGNQVSRNEMTVSIPVDYLHSIYASNLSNTNTQALAVINGDYYVTLLKFGAGNNTGGVSAGSAIIKISMKDIDENLDAEPTFTEYFKACLDDGRTPSVTMSPATTLVGNDGAIESSAVGYAMGGASDGEYLYLAYNKNENGSFVVKKVDAQTYEQVAVSDVADTSEDVAHGDNTRLFIKDGTLYVVAGDIYSILLDEFVPNCSIAKDEKMTALLTDNGNRVLKSVHWSESQRRYIVLDNGDSRTGNWNPGGDAYILDENGKFVDVLFPWKSGGWKNADVTGDDNYFYVLYNKTKESLVMDVYRYDGSLATSLSASGIRVSGNVNFNVQSIFFHNGDLHAGVCSWQEGHLVYHDWVAICDISVFPRA